MQFGQIPQVSAAQVPSDGFLLDVREDEEWAAGHAESAVHIPMSDFVNRFGELGERVGSGERVHVVCKAGGRSAKVAQYLQQQGWDAVNVDGGMLAWEDAGRPLVGGTGDNPAQVV